jgi:hypothetical protein
MLNVSGFDMIQLASEDEARALDRYFVLWDEYTSVVEPERPDPKPKPALPAQSFRDLLGSIRRRPSMYLGQSSITLLRAFFQGYIAGAEGTGLRALDVPDFGSFSRWLCARQGISEDYRWDRLLLLFHRSESRACEEFFLALSEFETEQGQHH